ncbi:hypothetical protein [Bradyrhizobium sp. RT3a]|uniref:hypothetical protein n=1 Tax=unclassified Bradyrhizobium TaxID=2631580 RepID=UPI003397770C
MDKPSFLDHAPSFYSVAVACTLLEGKQRELWTILQIKEGAPPALHAILVHDALVEAALRVLVAAGVVAVARMPFGPPVYRRLPSLNTDWLYSEAGREMSVYATFAQLKNYQWLRAALADVNEQYHSLSIQPADFEEAAPSLWEPLPLDRRDEKLAEAVEAVDDAITKIEADNGYAANVPGERDYVVQSLKTFRSALKESVQITGMQIKTFALDPLGIVIRRFSGAALELVAGAARDAIVAWLKAKFGALLALLF